MRSTGGGKKTLENSLRPGEGQVFFQRGDRGERRFALEELPASLWKLRTLLRGERPVPTEKEGGANVSYAWQGKAQLGDYFGKGTGVGHLHLAKNTSRRGDGKEP